MKVAVSVSKDMGLASPIDSRFGRTQGFLIVDSETRQGVFVSNDQNLNAAQGAGIQAAQHVLDAEADVVITGHCGPKAFRVLSGGGVRVYLGANGNAGDVLDSLLAGELQQASSPDVEGHWQG